MRFALVQIDNGTFLECVVPDPLAIQESNECIVDSSGVLDHGFIVRMTESEQLDSNEKMAKILRRATLQDQARDKENAIKSRMAAGSCEKAIAKLKLDMKLISVRYSFDCTVLRIIFCSEERVDFRQFIKDMATEMNVRVEMKQVGVRDQASMTGGIAPCGRSLCCSSWLKHFESINVRMAKVQKLSLNPAAIGGMCGRLKCCLRFENDQYVEASRRMPRDGARVECSEGSGVVIERDVLTERMKVRLDNERIIAVSLKDVTMP